MARKIWKWYHTIKGNYATISIGTNYSELHIIIQDAYDKAVVSLDSDYVPVIDENKLFLKELEKLVMHTINESGPIVDVFHNRKNAYYNVEKIVNKCFDFFFGKDKKYQKPKDEVI